MRAARRFSSPQYYWLTAFIAARGAQTTTCRVFAAIIVGLGVIPLLMIGSSVGPQSVQGQVVAVAVFACSLVLAAVWLRHCWPTPIQSLACVVVGTLCIAAGCLIPANPVVGMLGTTTFAVPGAYIVCFHTARLLTFAWAVAAATIAVLGVRLAATDVSVAVAAAVLVALINVFIVFCCRMVMRLVNSDSRRTEIEPLTGLLNREAFYQEAATLLASRSRDDDRHLVVAVVNIDSFALRTDMAGERAGNHARVSVGQVLRENVRHNAVLAHVADDEFLIADTFTHDDPSPLVERVRGAITTTRSGLTASIGVVCTPLQPLTAHPPHEVLDEVISIASTATSEARRAGGNQGRYVRRPKLAVLGDYGTDN
ncbi:GGDEF domain-containing protein [Mycobacterium hubeiense]|uniref:GGDEF domain-containing protein n=1 Tax=Mycobacterium hubeiense TaxID=1867256 RepID=UPI000C7F37B6|nr:GGDEF domain-containing protein [Mycobacterium sp. QGD 101]